MSKCMIDMFETTVSRFPNRIAVADEKKEITFAKLKKYALEIANRINGGNAPLIIFFIFSTGISGSIGT